MAKENDLSTLVRLKKWLVDEEQRKMADILGKIAEVENHQRMLVEHVKSEQEVTQKDPEGIGFAYGQFANAMLNVRDQLQQTRDKLENDYLYQQERVAEAYRDLKTVEQLQQNRETRARIEKNRKEQSILDEMAATSHRRKVEGR